MLLRRHLHVHSALQVVAGFAVWGEDGMEVLQSWFVHGQGDHVIVAQALHVRSVHQVVEGCVVWQEGGISYAGATRRG